MDESTRREKRLRDVRRIFEENRFGNAELLEGWDGSDVGELVDLVTEEEFHTLLDALEKPDKQRTE